MSRIRKNQAAESGTSSVDSPALSKVPPVMQSRPLPGLDISEISNYVIDFVRSVFSVGATAPAILLELMQNPPGVITAVLLGPLVFMFMLVALFRRRFLQMYHDRYNPTTADSFRLRGGPVAPPTNPLLLLPAVELSRRIQVGELTSVALTEACIARIEEVNPALNAIASRCYDLARAQAVAADAAAAAARTTPLSTPLHPLHGVPFVVKECMEVPGHPYTVGIHTRRGTLGTDWQPAVKRLIDAGLVLLATTTTSEGAMFHECTSPVYGRTTNPYDTDRSCGGSSGGCGALVAAGAAPLALTSDVGGSTRIPALYNGLFGVKPSGGAIPNSRNIPAIAPDNVISRYCQLGPTTRYAVDLLPFLLTVAAPDGVDQWVNPALHAGWRRCDAVTVPYEGLAVGGRPLSAWFADDAATAAAAGTTTTTPAAAAGGGAGKGSATKAATTTPKASSGAAAAAAAKHDDTATPTKTTTTPTATPAAASGGKKGKGKGNGAATHATTTTTTTTTTQVPTPAPLRADDVIVIHLTGPLGTPIDSYLPPLITRGIGTASQALSCATAVVGRAVHSAAAGVLPSIACASAAVRAGQVAAKHGAPAASSCPTTTSTAAKGAASSSGTLAAAARRSSSVPSAKAPPAATATGTATADSATITTADGTVYPSIPSPNPVPFSALRTDGQTGPLRFGLRHCGEDVEQARVRARAAAALADAGAQVVTMDVTQFPFVNELFDLWSACLSGNNEYDFGEIIEIGGKGTIAAAVVETLRCVLSGGDSDTHTIPAAALSVIDSITRSAWQRPRILANQGKCIELRSRLDALFEKVAAAACGGALDLHNVNVADLPPAPAGAAGTAGTSPTGLCGAATAPRKKVVMLAPSLPTRAPRHSENVVRFLSSVHTGIWNVLQLPACAVPMGVVPGGVGPTNTTALPTGVQIVGPYGADCDVVYVAALLQQMGLAGWVPPQGAAYV